MLTYLHKYSMFTSLFVWIIYFKSTCKTFFIFVLDKSLKNGNIAVINCKMFFQFFLNYKCLFQNAFIVPRIGWLLVSLANSFLLLDLCHAWTTKKIKQLCAWMQSYIYVVVKQKLWILQLFQQFPLCRWHPQSLQSLQVPQFRIAQKLLWMARLCWIQEKRFTALKDGQ